MILVATQLCDQKDYCQTVALDAVRQQDRGIADLVLFVDVQSGHFLQPTWDTLRRWLEAWGPAFAGVVLEVWHDSRDQDYADTNWSERIRPITYAREKARIYAMNRVVGHEAGPAQGQGGAAFYSPVSERAAREFTHIFYVDADVEPPPHALRRLLELDAPLASGVFWGRKGSGPAGRLPYVFQKNKDGHYGVHAMTLPGAGVVEADFVGGGCLLVRHDVFSRLSWRHWKTDADETYWAEDAYYCMDATRLGLERVKVAVDVRCRHHDPSGQVV